MGSEAGKAIRRRRRVPSSGSSPGRVARTMGPTPVTTASSGALAARSRSLATGSVIARSRAAIGRVRRSIMASMSAAISSRPALWRRAFSALRISTSWRRRPRTSPRRARAGLVGAVTGGERRVAISARTRAKTRARTRTRARARARSVSAMTPMARANARACRGSMRAKGVPRPARAAMGGRSHPLVASRTTEVSGAGVSAEAAMASPVFSTRLERPSGRAWRSRTARERSQPLTVRGLGRGSCRARSAGPSNR